jgi:hypothetical protein
MSSSTDSGVRGYPAAAAAAGKYYFEATLTLGSGGSGGAIIDIGVATAAQILNTQNCLHSCLVQPPSNIVSNNAIVGAVSVTLATGQVVSIAVDLVNLTFWARINGGNWNNSGAANPATNTGGISLSGAGFSGQSAYPFFASFLSGSAVVANFGATAFAYPVPSGFSSWDSIVPPPTQMQVTQAATEIWAAPQPPRMQVTQCAVEVWASVNVVGAPSKSQSVVTPGAPSFGIVALSQTQSVNSFLPGAALIETSGPPVYVPPPPATTGKGSQTGKDKKAPKFFGARTGKARALRIEHKREEGIAALLPTGPTWPVSFTEAAVAGSVQSLKASFVAALTAPASAIDHPTGGFKGVAGLSATAAAIDHSLLIAGFTGMAAEAAAAIDHPQISPSAWRPALVEMASAIDQPTTAAKHAVVVNELAAASGSPLATRTINPSVVEGSVAGDVVSAQRVINALVADTARAIDLFAIPPPPVWLERGDEHALAIDAPSAVANHHQALIEAASASDLPRATWRGVIAAAEAAIAPDLISATQHRTGVNARRISVSADRDMAFVAASRAPVGLRADRDRPSISAI